MLHHSETFLCRLASGAQIEVNWYKCEEKLLPGFYYWPYCLHTRLSQELSVCAQVHSQRPESGRLALGRAYCVAIHDKFKPQEGWRARVGNMTLSCLQCVVLPSQGC